MARTSQLSESEKPPGPAEEIRVWNRLLTSASDRSVYTSEAIAFKHYEVQYRGTIDSSFPVEGGTQ